MPDPAAEARIRDLERRLDLDPGSRLFVSLADEYRKVGRVRDALSALQKGLLAHPGYVAAQVALGRTYMEANQATDAIATFTKVHVNDPANLVAAKSHQAGHATAISVLCALAAVLHVMDCFVAKMLADRGWFSRRRFRLPWFWCERSRNPRRFHGQAAAGAKGTAQKTTGKSVAKQVLLLAQKQAPGQTERSAGASAEQAYLHGRLLPGLLRRLAQLLRPGRIFSPLDKILPGQRNDPVALAGVITISPGKVHVLSYLPAGSSF